MAKQRNPEPVFLDGPPEVLERKSHSPYDAFRAKLKENAGRWAELMRTPDRGVAQSKASVVRGGRGRWGATDNGKYESALGVARDENHEPTGEIAVLVRYVNPQTASEHNADAADAAAINADADVNEDDENTDVDVDEDVNEDEDADATDPYADTVDA